ncbi:MAG: hypothetical protein H6670_05280 [Anaerolineaceae bacterium]|nr:hypothetical protein [Anaerolineaceae bacterium]
MQVRPATLDDIQAISALMRTRIRRWQRWRDDGRVEDVPYNDLTLYERWLHGGAWMSTETGAIWLSHLCRGAGTALVLLDDDENIIGYTEAYNSNEIAPLGKHVYIHEIVTQDDTARDFLMQYWIDQRQKAGRITVSFANYDSEQHAYYERYGFKPLLTLYSIQVSAQQGQGFYRTSEHLDADPKQIRELTMPIGCTTSARHQWETLWPSHWDAVPQIVAQETHRLLFSAAAQDAYVLYQRHLYDPRGATVYCWSHKSVSSQLMVALKDWAHREGYRTLYLTGDAKLAKLAAGDDIGSPQTVIYARDA